ncbi:TRAP transporter substrate-binding protein DctP [Methyloversatilis thermotolerans]|uniref:TRAP transporter substrate-binding protein DctP n=1 Tax=Methyloversatilis thermotolerans TaxID=1346290 RepID=UPI00036D4F0E|nr:TRAP transporter substrate-binding protein DctP [Methyloversatilis thermotolerans]
MNTPRRFALRSLVASVLSTSVLAVGLVAAQPAVAQTTLKLSHQFPAATSPDGDFRDRLAKQFAAEVEKRTNGQVKITVYPGNSLMKTNSQFGALRKGALDLTVLPLAYGGGEVPEVNLTLMPALITSYEQGLRWRTSPIGQKLERHLEEKGMKILTWVWQAGGIASADKAVVAPDDVKGIKFRGGSREMDVMLKEAGAAITNVPSNEIYSGMQSKVLDAALTSSTSHISFRLYETSKAFTTGRDHSFWYMFEPLLISMSTFNRLTPEQQKVMVEVGQSLEKFAMEEAKKDDERAAEVFAKAGIKVVDMDEASFNKWRDLAQKTAWKDFAEKVKDGKTWMDMATSVK